MRALCAVEEVAVFILFGFGGGGVEVWVGDLSGLAVGADEHGVIPGDDGGEGGGGEDVAVGEKRGVVSGWLEERGEMGGRMYPYSSGRVRVKGMLVVELEVEFFLEIGCVYEVILGFAGN